MRSAPLRKWKCLCHWSVDSKNFCFKQVYFINQGLTVCSIWSNYFWTKPSFNKTIFQLCILDLRGQTVCLHTNLEQIGGGTMSRLKGTCRPRLAFDPPVKTSQMKMERLTLRDITSVHYHAAWHSLGHVIFNEGTFLCPIFNYRRRRWPFWIVTLSPSEKKSPHWH